MITGLIPSACPSHRAWNRESVPSSPLLHWELVLGFPAAAKSSCPLPILARARSSVLEGRDPSHFTRQASSRPAAQRSASLTWASLRRHSPSNQKNNRANCNSWAHFLSRRAEHPIGHSDRPTAKVLPLRGRLAPAEKKRVRRTWDHVGFHTAHRQPDCAACGQLRPRNPHRNRALHSCRPSRSYVEWSLIKIRYPTTGTANTFDANPRGVDRRSRVPNGLGHDLTALSLCPSSTFSSRLPTCRQCS